MISEMGRAKPKGFVACRVMISRVVFLLAFLLTAKESNVLTATCHSVHGGKGVVGRPPPDRNPPSPDGDPPD